MHKHLSVSGLCLPRMSEEGKESIRMKPISNKNQNNFKTICAILDNLKKVPSTVDQCARKRDEVPLRCPSSREKVIKCQAALHARK